MMAKMKYSEIPRDLSSDSMAAFRLAQGSPDRDKWKREIRESTMDRTSPESSSPVDSPPPRLFQSTGRRSTSAFRSHCLGRKESPEPESGSNYDIFVSSSRTNLDKDIHRSRYGASPNSHTLHHSLPRSVACKSSSLPASARTGLSSMLCVDTSALERSNCSSPVVQSIVHVSAENVAGQLTLLVVPIFAKIQPEELTSCGWSKSNKLEIAPNVVAMTRHFNHVSFWAVQEILNETNVRSRAEVVSHFIRIAKKLHELNNLHTMWSVISALRSAPIFRLQKTWNAVPKKDSQLMERLAELFSDHNNSEKLRQHMDTLKLPCVPYLGLFLSDVNFIDVAHPHYGGLESQKRQLKMNNILRILANYQQSDYSFLPVKDHIMEYLRSAKYIEELQKLLEDDQYRLSLRLEPATPASSSTSSKESFYDVKQAMGQLNVSPRKAALKSAASAASADAKFVPGHTKSRSLGTKLRSASLPRSAFRRQFSASGYAGCDSSIFRNAANSSSLKGGDSAWRNSVTSVSNQGFDSTLRNLIDDSVQEEKSHLHSLLHPDQDFTQRPADTPSTKGSTHSLNGLDSPLPPPPVRCCIIQGCVRKKAIMKDGRRPTVCAWQRYWIQLSGPNLLFYQPKYLRGTDRTDFRRRPFKAVSITGWTIEQHHSSNHPSTILLTNVMKGDVYKLRIFCPDAMQDWLSFLKLAVETPAESSDPENLMSFE